MGGIGICQYLGGQQTLLRAAHPFSYACGFFFCFPVPIMFPHMTVFWSWAEIHDSHFTIDRPGVDDTVDFFLASWLGYT